MKKRYFLSTFLPIFILLTGIAFADDPGNRGKDWADHYDMSSAITGTILNETSAAMEGAVITVTRIGLPTFSRSDTSDAAGAWFVGKLMAGIYAVKAEKADYLPQYYNHSETLLGAKMVTLAKKDTLRGIQFDLAPGAAISGTVHAADGSTPLPGADVSVYKPRDARDIFKRLYTKSDETGKYRISGLATGGYLVVAEHDGYIAEFYQDAAVRTNADTVKVVAPEEKTGIDFSLAQTSAITGLITSKATGLPIPNAWVAAYSKPTFAGKRLQSVGKTRSDNNGIYTMSIRPGSYMVTAEANGYAAEWFDNVATIDLATAVEVQTGAHSKADFALTGWGSLSGVVTNGVTTAPIAGATINAYNEEKGIGQRRSYRAVSLEDGTYAFAGLPSGRYIIEAEADGYLKEYWQEADSLRNATIVAMVSGNNISGINFTLSTGGAIQGLVTDAADKLPIANALIKVQSLRGHIETAGRTDAEGKYLITGLKSGAYLVSAATAGYVPQWYDNMATQREATQVQVVSPNATSNVDFALGKIAPLPRSISGLVIDDTTSLPIQNAMIMAMPVRAFARPRTAMTADDGTYVIRGLTAGNYLLVIHAAGYKGEFYDGVYSWKDAKTVEVIAGQELTGIDIGLSPQSRGAYQIAGKVADKSGTAVDGALVTLKADDQIVASAVTAEDGSYSVAGLPADSYVLSASVPGYEDSVPAAEPLTLGGTINLYGLTLLVTAKTTDVETSSALPSQFDLGQNYPNPFNPSTQITFSLAQAGMVRLTVYDMLGREIKQLAHAQMTAGQHSAIWDGADNRGEKAASGIYFYRIEVQTKSESFTSMRRMLLIK